MQYHGLVSVRKDSRDLFLLSQYLKVGWRIRSEAKTSKVLIMASFFLVSSPTQEPTRVASYNDSAIAQEIPRDLEALCQT